jgi:hypothetical protein
LVAFFPTTRGFLPATTVVLLFFVFVLAVFFLLCVVFLVAVLKGGTNSSFGFDWFELRW